MDERNFGKNSRPMGSRSSHGPSLSRGSNPSLSRGTSGRSTPGRSTPGRSTSGRTAAAEDQKKSKGFSFFGKKKKNVKEIYPSDLPSDTASNTASNTGFDMDVSSDTAPSSGMDIRFSGDPFADTSPRTGFDPYLSGSPDISGNSGFSAGSDFSGVQDIPGGPDFSAGVESIDSGIIPDVTDGADGTDTADITDAANQAQSTGFVMYEDSELIGGDFSVGGQSAEPVAAVNEEPAPVEEQEPAPAEEEEPAPVEVEEPAPVEAEEPAPAEVEEPAPAEEEEPAPVEVEEPAPVEAEEPAPAEVEEPAPAEVEEPAPAEVEEPAPVEAEEPAPAEAEEPAPVEAEEPVPVKAEEPAAMEKPAVPPAFDPDFFRNLPIYNNQKPIARTVAPTALDPEKAEILERADSRGRNSARRERPDRGRSVSRREKPQRYPRKETVNERADRRSKRERQTYYDDFSHEQNPSPADMQYTGQNTQQASFMPPFGQGMPNQMQQPSPYNAGMMNGNFRQDQPNTAGGISPSGTIPDPDRPLRDRVRDNSRNMAMEERRLRDQSHNRRSTDSLVFGVIPRASLSLIFLVVLIIVTGVFSVIKLEVTIPVLVIIMIIEVVMGLFLAQMPSFVSILVAAALTLAGALTGFLIPVCIGNAVMLSAGLVIKGE